MIGTTAARPGIDAALLRELPFRVRLVAEDGARRRIDDQHRPAQFHAPQSTAVARAGFIEVGGALRDPRKRESVSTPFLQRRSRSQGREKQCGQEDATRRAIVDVNGEERSHPEPAYLPGSDTLGRGGMDPVQDAGFERANRPLSIR